MIEVSDVRKRYGDIEVLRGVNLRVERGEIVSIVGPSGAGKSTLLQIIGSLERPESGRVVIDGQDVFALSDSRLAAFRNQRIGFVFQAHRLLPEFTMTENVALPAMIGGASHSDAMARARTLIDRLGLGHRAGHRPSELSGGECQRAAVARALINNPSVILADEPSGALDSRNRAELHRLLFDLRRDFGHTFLIVTHDEGLADGSDRIIRMADGLTQ
ncbi:MAG: ABC transporter ATP-binding protein [Muribaculaceae bacterium]|nr:ABC transporter ATP-binding protein [Muribaculaceae bacterium]